MPLNSDEIVDCMNKNEIRIEPFNHNNLNLVSYDLTLHHEYLQDDGNGGWIVVHAGQDGIISIPPLTCVQLITREFAGTQCSHITSSIVSKSTLSRRGILISKAGFGDPGFHNRWSVLAFNAMKTPLTVKAGSRFCQIYFDYVTRCENVYASKGHYQTNVKPDETNWKIHDILPVNKNV